MPTDINRSTSSLIGSDRVQGTSVFDADAEKIGAIECVMIEKVSGRVSFAVLSFGGFLGIGAKDIAVSLQMMTVMRDSNGDRTSVQLSRRKIELAPGFQRFTGKPAESLSQTSPKSK